MAQTPSLSLSLPHANTHRQVGRQPGHAAATIPAARVQVGGEEGGQEGRPRVTATSTGLGGQGRLRPGRGDGEAQGRGGGEGWGRRRHVLCAVWRAGRGCQRRDDGGALGRDRRAPGELPIEDERRA